jgi:molybdopterin-synthase adenylyltransferase
MEKVGLKPSVEPFAASTGDIYLLRNDGAGDVVIRGAGPFARALVSALAAGETTHLPERLAAEGLASASDTRAAVAELHAAGLLTRAPQEGGTGQESLSPSERLRYDRQLHYFRDQADTDREASRMQLALRGATVVVLGAGGLGTWTMAGLVCAGVGRVVAVDDDAVELSNLNRQVLYRTADVGRSKVEVAKEALGALNPQVEVVAVRQRVDGAGAVRSLAREADFVACTADAPIHEIGRWVNAACLSLGVPHISAGQFPPRIRIGPTFIPGRTACLGCQEQRIRRDFPLYDELVAHRQATNSVAATLGAASGLIGSLLAMEVIHHLTGICEPATTGRGLVVDLRDLSVTWESVEPDPSCELGCGGSVTGPAG